MKSEIQVFMNASLGAGVSFVERSAAGALVSWQENGFGLRVRRSEDSKTIVLELSRTSAGGAAHEVLNFNASGAYTGSKGDFIPTVFAAELRSGGVSGSRSGLTLDAAGLTVGGAALTAEQQAVARAGIAIGGTIAEYPDEFSWDVWMPDVVRSDAGLYSAVVNPRDHVDPLIWTGAAYHVDVVGGSTGNTGLGAFDGDFSAPAQQISAAITAGNATGAPYRIYAKAGYYAGSRCINGSSQVIEPTQHCAIIAVGGSVYNNAGDAIIAWTQDGTYTNLYKYTVASISRVFDLAQTDADGAPLEFTVAADLATCDATDNTYILTGGVLYINRADGLAATTANTLVTRALKAASFAANTKDLYFEGIKFCGGIEGALFCDAIASRNIVTVNCDYIGCGSSAYLFDGHRVRRTNGLVLDVNGKCFANPKDGFNYHYDNGPSGGKMHVVLVSPTAKGNGRFASTSNNGITAHDDVRLIVVNPTVAANRVGADYHTIENTESVIFGGSVANTSAGGSTPNAAVKASDSSKIWCDGVAVSATTGNAIYAQGGQIKMKNSSSFGTLLSDGGGSISSW